MLELTYFAARGSCDKIRLLLAECSISYKENIISGYDFEDIKYKIEFGSLPLLMDGDTRIAGPIAIFRYLASKYYMFGNNLAERAKCDMWIEACEDIQQEYWRFDSKENSKPAEKVFLDECIAPKYSQLCQMLSMCKGDFLVGDKLSCADIILFSVIDNLNRYLPLILPCFPLLSLFHQKIGDRTRIKQFCDSEFRY